MRLDERRCLTDRGLIGKTPAFSAVSRATGRGCPSRIRACT